MMALLGASMRKFLIKSLTPFQKPVEFFYTSALEELEAIFKYSKSIAKLSLGISKWNVK
jgi:hypothetical protein